MITSKLSTKAQTTIPQSVRLALGLKEGEELVYEIVGARVTITRRSPAVADDPFATFEEWDGEADRALYAKL